MPDSMATVLLVDDEELVRNVSSLMLKRLGYNVLAAADGAEAVALYREHRDAIDLVLLDASLPGLSGPDTLKALHAMNPSLPVVLASGYTEPEARAQFEGLDVAGFLQKPYQMPVLDQQVRAVLR